MSRSAGSCGRFPLEENGFAASRPCSVATASHVTLAGIAASKASVDGGAPSGQADEIVRAAPPSTSCRPG